MARRSVTTSRPPRRDPRRGHRDFGHHGAPHSVTHHMVEPAPRSPAEISTVLHHRPPSRTRSANAALARPTQRRALAGRGSRTDETTRAFDSIDAALGRGLDRTRSRSAPTVDFTSVLISLDGSARAGEPVLAKVVSDLLEPRWPSRYALVCRLHEFSTTISGFVAPGAEPEHPKSAC